MSRDGIVGRLRAHQSTLWIAALLLYGFGDLITTTVGLSHHDIVEVGPVAQPIVGAYGTLGLAVLKSATLFGSYLVWRLVPPPHRVGIPLGLAIVGIAVTGWNTAVIWVAVQ